MTKKLLLAGAVAALTQLVLAKIRASQAEAELWAEATDPVRPTDAPA